MVWTIIQDGIKVCNLPDYRRIVEKGQGDRCAIGVGKPKRVVRLSGPNAAAR
jgi:hypothetical protein